MAKQKANTLNRKSISERTKNGPYGCSFCAVTAILTERGLLKHAKDKHPGEVFEVCKKGCVFPLYVGEERDHECIFHQDDSSSDDKEGAEDDGSGSSGAPSGRHVVARPRLAKGAAVKCAGGRTGSRRSTRGH